MSAGQNTDQSSSILVLFSSDCSRDPPSIYLRLIGPGPALAAAEPFGRAQLGLPRCALMLVRFAFFAFRMYFLARASISGNKVLLIN